MAEGRRQMFRLQGPLVFSIAVRLRNKTASAQPLNGTVSQASEKTRH